MYHFPVMHFFLCQSHKFQLKYVKVCAWNVTKCENHDCTTLHVKSGNSFRVRRFRVFRIRSASRGVPESHLLGGNFNLEKLGLPTQHGPRRVDPSEAGPVGLRLPSRQETKKREEDVSRLNWAEKETGQEQKKTNVPRHVRAETLPPHTHKKQLIPRKYLCACTFLFCEI